ncbi:bifunctional hydroxymethylpyrimidine kinase/phosphomethylpyrimidine kinase [Microbacterium sp. Marseille-Q6648]|uniref:bifunctional hydroxymethylpyrimidine kinase/phosphomethylpyrimidine kinase n=1 Tax=Microbacterium sp. Marseille-Q6648 TaxID=2937991 RepID=UPI00203FE2E5|nr:bifunctional hydroxymethylpyrimidine kinase/phosphomethylpyrimidine kinase [Microbacterium sp. Marseille-Q6648]
MTARAVPRVLSIAGTDPTGGAGIHADLKTIGALGGYGMAAVTALVAQNTRGVRRVHVPPASFLRDQLDAVADDVDIDAVKIGMLQSKPLIDTVSGWLDSTRPPIAVLDPVMVATSGDRLLDEDAVAAIRALCARADLVTPNLPELAVLVDRPPAASWEKALAQARGLADSTGAAVLVKGGHLPAGGSPDAIVDADAVFELAGPRVATTSTHGTGCSLSSAMAVLRAQGLSWPDALTRAKDWLTGALRAADALEVGRGRGPIDHFHESRPTADWASDAWAACADIRSGVDACAFVIELRDGTLPGQAFAWYLAQDALYLREYARVLARLSAMARTRNDQEFWTDAARGALVEEARLHRSRIGDVEVDAAPSTRAYVDHLHAVSASGRYGELVAAVLPCFWLYHDLGRRWRTHRHEGHPYGDWLAAYGDPGFADATNRAIAVAGAVAAAASPSERDLMHIAFRRSMGHELAFFAAPLAASTHAPAQVSDPCSTSDIEITGIDVVTAGTEADRCEPSSRRTSAN